MFTSGCHNWIIYFAEHDIWYSQRSIQWVSMAVFGSMTEAGTVRCLFNGFDDSCLRCCAGSGLDEPSQAGAG